MFFPITDYLGCAGLQATKPSVIALTYYYANYTKKETKKQIKKT